MTDPTPRPSEEAPAPMTDPTPRPSEEAPAP